MDLSDVVKAIDDEPEFSDRMPAGMWDAIRDAAARGDREFFDEAFRVSARLTKDGIKRRVMSLSAESQEHFDIDDATWSAVTFGSDGGHDRIRFIEACADAAFGDDSWKSNRGAVIELVEAVIKSEETLDHFRAAKVPLAYRQTFSIIVTCCHRLRSFASKERWFVMYDDTATEIRAPQKRGPQLELPLGDEREAKSPPRTGNVWRVSLPFVGSTLFEVDMPLGSSPEEVKLAAEMGQNVIARENVWSYEEDEERDLVAVVTAPDGVSCEVYPQEEGEEEDEDEGVLSRTLSLASLTDSRAPLWFARVISSAYESLTVGEFHVRLCRAISDSRRWPSLADLEGEVGSLVGRVFEEIPKDNGCVAFRLTRDAVLLLVDVTTELDGQEYDEAPAWLRSICEDAEAKRKREG